MPKRATITFSSDDAPTVDSEELHVYYCKWSGKHAMTTNCDLRRAPRRRTDNSSVIDTQRYTVRLYTSSGGTKMIRRHNGAIERQYRLNIGKLPVAYRSEESGRFVYVLSDAVTKYGTGRSDPSAAAEETPVPPCIKPCAEPAGCQIAVEIEDRADKASVLKILPEFVRLEITGSITATEASEEILALIRSMLGVRLGQLSLERGHSTRHKTVLLEGMTPRQAFDKLQKAIAQEY